MADANTMLVRGDLMYRVSVIPRRLRKPAVETFVEGVPFRIAVATPDETPVAVVCDIHARAGWGVGKPVEFRRHGDGLVSEGLPLEDVVSHADGIRVGSGKGFPHARHVIWSTSLGDEHAAAVAGRILSTEREAALAAATAEAGRAVVLGDTVWVGSAQPVWTVGIPSGATREVRVDSRLQSEIDGWWTVAFHIADREAAEAHARWIVGGTGPLPGGQVVSNDRPADIRLAPDRAAFAVAAALTGIAAIARTDMGRDFPSLSVDVLEAWLAFRRASDAAIRGDVEAIAPAYGALGTLKALLPAPITEGPYDAVEAATGLRRRLDNAVRHWESYLSGIPLVPVPVQDEEALASLAM